MARLCFGCMNMTSLPVCEHCGYPANGCNEPHQLPVGTVLRGQYTVGKALGQGGFGITYLGWDNYLETPVAIKEYYPSALVKRECSRTLMVTCATAQVGDQFNSSRERFLREAKALAKFENIPAVVKIRSFFPENNTAYIIMEYVKGMDLGKYISMRGGRLSPQEAFRLLMPVMSALDAVHKSGMVHRDISPDNVILHPVEGAKLLDFGAVKMVENAGPEKNLTQSTEAILKHGFAPPEQYQNRGNLGPWTDVYALCATIYYCLTGRMPINALDRMMGEGDVDWNSIPGLTPNQRSVLRQGMSLRASERFQSMGALMNALFPAQPAPLSPSIPNSGIRGPAAPIQPSAVRPAPVRTGVSRSTADILNSVQTPPPKPQPRNVSVRSAQPPVSPALRQPSGARSTDQIMNQYQHSQAYGAPQAQVSQRFQEKKEDPRQPRSTQDILSRYE